jgi:hypothetical protein
VWAAGAVKRCSTATRSTGFDGRRGDRLNAGVENLWMFGEKPVDEKTGRFFLRSQPL